MGRFERTKVGILGYGQVGKAIARFYRKVKIKDLKRKKDLKGVEILHICIPYGKNFVKIVAKEIKEVLPKLAIIHSTVAPGTTKEIIRILPRNLSAVVHSPVRGLHPHLFSHLKVFVKYIGAEDKRSAKLAKTHLNSLGIKTKVFIPSLITEIGKLLSTSYYGLCIAFHGEMKRICDKFKIDFEKTVTHFNRTYNLGYGKLGYKNFIRPILYPPQKTKGIGGHCIVENAKILKKHFSSKALDLILAYRKNGPLFKK